MLYPVILSGGVGKRLWPVSTQNNPKQFRALLNDQTLLQNTYQRVLKGFDKNNIFVTTNHDLFGMIKQQIDIADENVFLEPEIKGTAMAIGFAAMKLLAKDPQAKIVTINSDHHIKEEDKYLQVIKEADKIVDKNPDQMVLIGIKPQYPEIGYGYIEFDSQTEDKGVYKIKSFKEKPAIDLAKQYLGAGNYLWNAAFFMFKAAKLLEWYQKYLPDVYQALDRISQVKETDPTYKQVLTEEYSKVQKICINIGLLEKMPNNLVIPADFHWADIGHWQSLRDIEIKSSRKKNATNSPNALLDSQGNLLYSFSNKLITAIGVEDMILVETEEAIFLCPTDRAHEVKDVLQELKNKKLDKYL